VHRPNGERIYLGKVQARDEQEARHAALWTWGAPEDEPVNTEFAIRLDDELCVTQDS
jgi:hypothetical protein